MIVHVFLVTFAASQVAALTKCPINAEIVPFVQNCMKVKLFENWNGLETEAGNAFSNLLDECFTSSSSGSKCTLTAADRNQDAFSDEKAFGKCTVCLQVTKLIKKLLMQAAENNPSKLGIFRQDMNMALAKATERCMGDYGFHVTRDVEAAEVKNYKKKIDILSEVIVARNRWFQCARESESRARATHQCLVKQMAMRSDMPKHCAALTDCATDDFTKVCCARMSSAVGGFCECTGEMLRDGMYKVLDASEQIKRVKTKSECMRTLNIKLMGVDIASLVIDASEKMFTSVKINDLMDEYCGKLEGLRADGYDAEADQMTENISHVLTFGGAAFEGFLSHIRARFCHCDIDCSQAFGRN